MGGGNGNDEEAFGGYSMGGGNGLTSGGDAQGTELDKTLLILKKMVKLW